MALASITVAGNGSQSTWSIPFSYIVASDIQASVNAVAVSAGNIAVAGANVTITPTPAIGSDVIIFRVTSTNPPRVSWASATDLNPSDLDTTLLQPLYAVEENTDTITTNNAQVASNTPRILANELDIAQNVTDISQNVTDISQNTTDIAQNVTDIAQNVTDISTEITDRAAAVTAEATLRDVADAALDTRTLALEASTSLAVGFVEIINIRYTSGVHPNTWPALVGNFVPVPLANVSTWIDPGFRQGSSASSGTPLAHNVSFQGTSSGNYQLLFATAGTWLCELQIMESFGAAPNMAAGLGFYDSATGLVSMTQGDAYASNISPTDITIAEQPRLAPIATPQFLEIVAGEKFDLWMQPINNNVTAQQNSAINTSHALGNLSWSLQAKFTKWG